MFARRHVPTISRFATAPGQVGDPPAGGLTTQLRSSGLSYNSRRHLITCTGPRTLRLPYTYMGADDQAGANYTGQPAVHSYHRQDR